MIGYILVYGRSHKRLATVEVKCRYLHSLTYMCIHPPDFQPPPPPCEGACLPVSKMCHVLSYLTPRQVSALVYFTSG
jgi:hypothetical protein